MLWYRHPHSVTLACSYSPCLKKLVDMLLLTMSPTMRSNRNPARTCDPSAEKQKDNFSLGLWRAGKKEKFRTSDLSQNDHGTYVHSHFCSCPRSIARPAALNDRHADTYNHLRELTFKLSVLVSIFNHPPTLLCSLHFSGTAADMAEGRMGARAWPVLAPSLRQAHVG